MLGGMKAHKAALLPLLIWRTQAKRHGWADLHGIDGKERGNKRVGKGPSKVTDLCVVK